MARYTRSDWGARPARGGPGNLTPSRVEGIALHWPAMSSPLRSVAAVMVALRSWQNYHMDDLGWSDIGYQVAVDQQGNRYELRGLATQSGANGGTDVNERFGAVLLVLAPGEEPSEAMVAEVRNVIADHRALFPFSRLIVGHSDIRPEPTACPGPAVSRGIRAGTFEPSEEDDMPTAEEIAHAVWTRFIPMGPNRENPPAQAVLRQTFNAAVAAKVDVDALAVAIVKALPAGKVDQAVVEAGVKKALADLVNGED